MPKCIGLATALLAAFAVPAGADSDFQWTFDNSGFFSYTLTSVSSTRLFSGSLPAANPVITLLVGMRYEVINVNSGAHPFQVLAKGSGAGSDVILLSQGSATGSMESDADVAWTDDGNTSNGKVAFTVTQALVDAMNAGGNNPGYRCAVHTGTMRGDFDVIGQKIVNPIPGHIPKGSITVELETTASGLVSPLGLAEADDESNRLFIHDQVGKVWIVDASKTMLPAPFLDVSSRLVPLGIAGAGSYDERGLLGFALHPDFAHHPKVYTYTSEPVEGAADFTVPMDGDFDHQDVLAEWSVSESDANVVDPATRKELFRNDHPEFNHDGGAIHFGPDGYLYLGIGDGGQGDDQGPGHQAGGNAQALNTILGKILRIDVDGGGTPSDNGKYGLPPSNPFNGIDGLREIYAYGLRNPYSFGFDPATGDLYLGDAGQNDIEEVDLITAGGNFGWRVKEGSFFFNPNGTMDGFVTNDPVVDPVPSDLVDPIAEYDHDEGHVVVGGRVYRGTAIPELAGLYVFGDFGTAFDTPSGRLFNLDSGNNINELRIGGDNRPVGLWIKGFGQDRAGNVYVCGSAELGPAGATGVVEKIVPYTGTPITSPTAVFGVATGSATTGMAPLTVTFQDQSTPGSSPITAWEWTFGDGTSSTDQNPTHTYADEGNYTVSLTVTTTAGSDSDTKTDYIVVTAKKGCVGSSIPPKGSYREFAGDITALGGACLLLILFGRAGRARRIP